MYRFLGRPQFPVLKQLCTACPKAKNECVSFTPISYTSCISSSLIFTNLDVKNGISVASLSVVYSPLNQFNTPMSFIYSSASGTPYFFCKYFNSGDLPLSLLFEMSLTLDNE